MAETDMKQASVLLLAGAVVGAAITLLYAQQSGARTRKDIKKFALKTVNRFDDLQGDIRDHVAEWVDDITEIVKDKADRGKKLSDKGYEQVLQGFDIVKKCVEDGRSRIEQLIKTT
jgi:gas vesicle protein